MAIGPFFGRTGKGKALIPFHIRLPELFSRLIRDHIKCDVRSIYSVRLNFH